jgi:hypothetical protein
MLHGSESHEKVLKLVQNRLSLVSAFYFNFNRQYSSPSCYSKSRHVDKHHRSRFKPNLERFKRLGRVYWAR